MSTDNPYQSPQVDLNVGATTRVTREKQTLGSILFSFEGRIPRRVYWGATLAVTFIFYAALFLAMLVFGEESNVSVVLILLLYIPMVWISLAVQIKRWHDRDKSGWWVFINVIPLIGPIISFAQTGCMRGTVGSNGYGPDPT